jgi:hypothetical protein
LDAARLLLPLVLRPSEAPAVTQTPTRTTTPTPTPTEESYVSCPCHDNVRNCSDFQYQSQAQQCYDHCWEQVGYDVHGLDADKDGTVCESLP